MFELFIETIFSLGLFVNACLFIPQILKLYKTKEPKMLSLTTFAGFNLIQLFVILHGYLHKDYLLMIGTAMNFITCGVLTLMIFLYRKQTLKSKNYNPESPQLPT